MSASQLARTVSQGCGRSRPEELELLRHDTTVIASGQDINTAYGLSTDGGDGVARWWQSGPLTLVNGVPQVFAPPACAKFRISCGPAPNARLKAKLEQELEGCCRSGCGPGKCVAGWSMSDEKRMAYYQNQRGEK
jgi:hypothetical protein